MELAVLCGLFLTFDLNVGIFRRILSVPHNVVMDLNNVMHGWVCKEWLFVVDNLKNYLNFVDNPGWSICDVVVAGIE